MKITIINSFEEYVTYTENYKNRYYFRGQSNIEWDITPSKETYLILPAAIKQLRKKWNHQK